MALDKRIKVIKRNERKRGEQATHTTRRRDEAQNKTAAAKNNAATIITSWVREVRQRKDEEARHDFASLFRTAA